MRTIKVIKKDYSNRNDITMFAKPEILYKMLHTDEAVEGYIKYQRNGIDVYLLFEKESTDSLYHHTIARFIVSYKEEGRPKLAESCVSMLHTEHEQAESFNMDSVKVVLEDLDEQIRWNRLWRSNDYKDYKSILAKN